jgi:hypothetical protein
MKQQYRVSIFPMTCRRLRSCRGRKEWSGRRYTRKGQSSDNTASRKEARAPETDMVRRKGEEKVRGRSRERCRAYIDGTDASRRQEKWVKAATGGAILKKVHTIPHREVRCPSAAGGSRRQSGGSMGAVSGAPLTVTTDTLIRLVL